jgi:hypothetical protein
MKTEKFNNMITAFSADFQLAIHGDAQMIDIDNQIKMRNARIMQDIDLLDELDFLLRYGQAEIHIVEKR